MMMRRPEHDTEHGSAGMIWLLFFFFLLAMQWDESVWFWIFPRMTL